MITFELRHAVRLSALSPPIAIQEQYRKQNKTKQKYKHSNIAINMAVSSQFSGLPIMTI